MGQRVRENEVSTLVFYFSQLPDPRIKNRCEHLLIDILVVTICAVLCGAQTCTDFEDFGRAKESWLKRFLRLPGGIPSHDTFRRVLTIVDPVEMEKIFSRWVKSIVGEQAPKRLSLDGKSIGGSPQGGIAGRTALHVVNVYIHDYALCLGQRESQGSGGESTAALELLDSLDIKDTLVLADAGFSVHRVAAKIREKKGHYLFALKDNNRFYRERVEQAFLQARRVKSAQTEDQSHGRVEVRTATILAAAEQDLDPKFFTQWPELKMLIRVDRMRTLEDKRPFLQKKNRQGEIRYERNAGLNEKKLLRTSEETVYFLTSKTMTAAQALKEVRRHWGIENGLHWVLDVAFGEDDWLARAKRLSRNLAAIRKIGLNLIRSNRSLPKKSVRRHMKSAGWSEEALAKLVFGSHFDA